MATCGYARSRQVPPFAATSARVCSKCDLWFAAGKRESVCDSCSPAETRTQRALRSGYTRTPPRTGKLAGQTGVKNDVVTVYSDALGLTFRCPASDPRASSLLSRVLAYELAAKERR